MRGDYQARRVTRPTLGQLVAAAHTSPSRKSGPLRHLRLFSASRTRCLASSGHLSQFGPKHTAKAAVGRRGGKAAPPSCDPNPPSARDITRGKDPLLLAKGADDEVDVERFVKCFEQHTSFCE